MTQVTRPASDVSNNNWAPTPLFIHIDAPAPNDFSPISTSVPPGGSFIVQLSPVARPITGRHILTVRLQATDFGAGSVTFSLLQGNQSIATRSVSVTGEFTNYDLILTEQEIDLITDYTNLSLQVSVGTSSSASSFSGPSSGSFSRSVSGSSGSSSASNSGSASLSNSSFDSSTSLSSGSASSGSPSGSPSSGSASSGSPSSGSQSSASSGSPSSASASSGSPSSGSPSSGSASSGSPSSSSASASSGSPSSGSSSSSSRSASSSSGSPLASSGGTPSTSGQSGSSTSGGTIGDCSACPNGAAAQFTASIGGITNNACNDCDNLNGTKIFTNYGGGCIWGQYPPFSNCTSPQVTMSFYIINGVVTFALVDLAYYTASATGWDCKSTLTLTLSSSPSPPQTNLCSNYPGTVTITPV
jgi:hypothetical protein